MATFYERAQQTALRLILSKGQKLPISRRGSGAVFDPVTGGFTAEGTYSTGELDGVVLPLSAGEIRTLSGGKVNADDGYLKDFVQGKMRKVLAAAVTAPFSPTSGDEVTFEENKWEVIGSTPLSPAGTDVIYTLAVRRK